MYFFSVSHERPIVIVMLHLNTSWHRTWLKTSQQDKALPGGVDLSKVATCESEAYHLTYCGDPQFTYIRVTLPNSKQTCVNKSHWIYRSTTYLSYNTFFQIESYQVIIVLILTSGKNKFSYLL